MVDPLCLCACLFSVSLCVKKSDLEVLTSMKHDLDRTLLINKILELTNVG